jgi:acetyl-CoA carboxylase carboxyl transferase subunit beta
MRAKLGSVLAKLTGQPEPKVADVHVAVNGSAADNQDA